MTILRCKGADILSINDAAVREHCKELYASDVDVYILHFISAAISCTDRMHEYRAVYTKPHSAVEVFDTEMSADETPAVARRQPKRDRPPAESSDDESPIARGAVARRRAVAPTPPQRRLRTISEDAEEPSGAAGALSGAAAGASGTAAGALSDEDTEPSDEDTAEPSNVDSDDMDDTPLPPLEILRAENVARNLQILRDLGLKFLASVPTSTSVPAPTSTPPPAPAARSVSAHPSRLLRMSRSVRTPAPAPASPMPAPVDFADTPFHNVPSRMFGGTHSDRHKVRALLAVYSICFQAQPTPEVAISDPLWTLAQNTTPEDINETAALIRALFARTFDGASVAVPSFCAIAAFAVFRVLQHLTGAGRPFQAFSGTMEVSDLICTCLGVSDSILRTIRATPRDMTLGSLLLADMSLQFLLAYPVRLTTTNWMRYVHPQMPRIRLNNSFLTQILLTNKPNRVQKILLPMIQHVLFITATTDVYFTANETRNIVLYCQGRVPKGIRITPQDQVTLCL